jgi:hypothetical protein
MASSRQEARETTTISNVKPFIETLRATNSVRQNQASSRKHTRANLIKLLRHSGKVSYLAYHDFETNPHPALLRSVKLSLRTREVDCLEYQAIANPPILHRQESVLALSTRSTPNSPS